MPRKRVGASETELAKLYAGVKTRIASRLSEFEHIGKTATDEQLFAELSFCLFTPQSKAKNCWAAVCTLAEEKLLLCGNPKRISNRMNGVRFHHTKGRYVAEAHRNFTKGGKLRLRAVLERFDDPRELREWLVENVKGMSYKEASHFLRNIGRGKDLAILDRHILRNMVALGALGEMPRSLPRRTYLEVELKLLKLAKRLKIPPDHLDMLLWYKEAGEVFK